MGFRKGEKLVLRRTGKVGGEGVDARNPARHRRYLGVRRGVPSPGLSTTDSAPGRASTGRQDPRSHLHLAHLMAEPGGLCEGKMTPSPCSHVEIQRMLMFVTKLVCANLPSCQLYTCTAVYTWHRTLDSNIWPLTACIVTRLGFCLF